MGRITRPDAQLAYQEQDVVKPTVEKVENMVFHLQTAEELLDGDWAAGRVEDLVVLQDIADRLQNASDLVTRRNR